MDKAASPLSSLLWRAPDEEAERLTRSFVDAARAAWPMLSFPVEAFLTHVARTSAPATPAELAALHGAELWLVCACLAHDAKALDLLERRYLVRTEGAIAQVDASAAFIDEVRQEVRDRLLLGERPRLGEYQGRGALAGWLKTVSARHAISRKRRPSPSSANDHEADFEVIGGVTSASHIEVQHLARRYHEAFTSAFREGLQRLAERDRAVLRLHYVERQSVDRIGALYDVHRATAARWVAAAREALQEHLLTAMKQRVGVPESELKSLVTALQTQLEVSLRSVL